jgi:hypothetical protein
LKAVFDLVGAAVSPVCHDHSSVRINGCMANDELSWLRVVTAMFGHSALEVLRYLLQDAAKLGARARLSRDSHLVKITWAREGRRR